jgi:hypothetical protein
LHRGGHRNHQQPLLLYERVEHILRVCEHES